MDHSRASRRVAWLCIEISAKSLCRFRLFLLIESARQPKERLWVMRLQFEERAELRFRLGCAFRSDIEIRQTQERFFVVRIKMHHSFQRLGCTFRIAGAL